MILYGLAILRHQTFTYSFSLLKYLKKYLLNSLIQILLDLTFSFPRKLSEIQGKSLELPQILRSSSDKPVDILESHLI